MNFSMQLAVVLAAACLCLADGAPDGRLVRTKQQRPTRGFKNVEMMTARGFGKRDGPHTRAELRDFDDFLENFGSVPEKDNMEITEDKAPDGIPVELFVMAMLKNPEFARTVVSKLLDDNQDGKVSIDELLRN